jgi:hypothetical protein
MQPTARLAAGHPIACKQRSGQRQAEKHHENDHRRMQLSRHQLRGRDINHRVERRQEQHRR